MPPRRLSQPSLPQPLYPSIPQLNPPRPASETLPTMYDLPSEDPEEPGLPDEFHDYQPQLLSRTLRLADWSSDRLFTGADLNLYYDVQHHQWYKRPDWFLALGVPRLYEGRELRSSYVTWQEGRSPSIVVELLSPGTAKEDLGEALGTAVEQTQGELMPNNPDDGSQPKSTNSDKVKPPRKWEVYEQILRVPHYFVYSRYNQQLRYFKLDGAHYVEQTLRAEPPLAWIPEFKIGLGIWQGEFEGVDWSWLRWCDQDGNWLLTDTELALAELERERSLREELIKRLHQQGISTDDLDLPD